MILCVLVCLVPSDPCLFFFNYFLLYFKVLAPCMPSLVLSPALMFPSRLIAIVIQVSMFPSVLDIS